MSARDWVDWCWSELDYIEYWVEAFHGWWKGQAVGICSDAAFHCEWSEAAVRKFLRWSGGVNITGIEVNLVAGGVDWSWGPPLVVVPGHIIFRLN